MCFFFFFQAEDGIRDKLVTGVQTCALPISVTRWLKHVGDPVEVDEPLLEVSTDKVDTEIPSPAAGVLQRIVVAEDETVEVGAELAVISDPAAAPKSTPA